MLRVSDSGSPAGPWEVGGGMTRAGAGPVRIALPMCMCDAAGGARRRFRDILWLVGGEPTTAAPTGRPSRVPVRLRPSAA